jgi:hypothetical protein
MSKHRGLIVFIVVVVAIAFLTKSAPPRPTPNPAGTFSFAALGDAPYYWWEDLRYRVLLRELDAYDLNFVLHVGDIWWHPCTDAMYMNIRKRFDRMRHPVVYTPGDNEWTDCWEPGSGGYAPLERLERIRQIFFSGPSRIPQVRQPEFIENARWTREGIVFATVNVVGSMNAMKRFPKRTPADDAAAKHRTEAAAAWMREAFAEARRTNARAVVIALHGVPPFEIIDKEYWLAYQPFTTALADEARRYPKPVLVIHGDDHTYTVDHPVQGAPNLTRLEVPGSPEVGWVRVYVTPNRAMPFAFEEHLVGGWKYW